MQTFLSLTFTCLQVLSFIVISEEILNKTTHLRVVLNSFENGVVGLINWRAKANLGDEIKGISYFFGISALFFASLYFLVIFFEIKPIENILLTVLSITVMGWIGFKWSLEHFLHTRLLYHSIVFVLVIPWIIFLIGLFFPEIRSSIFEAAQFVAKITVVSFLFILSAYLVAWIIFGGFPLLVFLTLWLSSKSSQYLQNKFDRNISLEIAIVIQILAIIYFNLKDILFKSL